MAKRPLLGLGSLQSEVMEIVWDRGEATVAQVHRQIASRRDVAYTTVLVALQKLEKKGWLTHRSEGRAYVYRAARSRETVRGGIVRDLVERVFAGDPQQLVLTLLDEHAWSDDDLAQLRRTIEQRRKEHRRG